MKSLSIIEKQKPGQCRECMSFCEKLIEPTSCLEIGCRYLYSYRDRVDDSEYIGCIQGVFAAEINFDLLKEAEKLPGGYGGLKVTRQPLKHCQFKVEKTFVGAGPDYSCKQMSFFDGAGADDGFRLADERGGVHSG